MSASQTQNVALFVSGGIAVYKACEVLRNLQKAGCDVRVCMTQSATKMVGTQTFEALSTHHVLTELFGDTESAIPHIELSEWADVALVCPATANLMAKITYGLADDAASATLLACTCPVVLAPAMNTNMWQNAATQANVATLKERGYLFAGPIDGHLACGTSGAGKLASPEAISNVVLAALNAAPLSYSLTGIHILITAGPTHEQIDPVRYLANNSTGKMGYALATAAAVHGARVTLVSGPSQLPDPLGVETIRITSAQEMLEACTSTFKHADGAILSAAVCDYRPAHVSDHKLKKNEERLDVLCLEENTDILATLCKTKGQRPVFGFAAETNEVLAHAQSKLKRKGCDLIIANDVSCNQSTFGSDTNKVYFVDSDGTRELPVLSKLQVAEHVIAELAARLAASKD